MFEDNLSLTAKVIELGPLEFTPFHITLHTNY